MGGHNSVDSSVPSILFLMGPWVRIPSTPCTLFSWFFGLIHLYWYLTLYWENKQKMKIYLHISGCEFSMFFVFSAPLSAYVCVGRFSDKMLYLQLLNSGVRSLCDTFNKILYFIKTWVTIGWNGTYTKMKCREVSTTGLSVCLMEVDYCPDLLLSSLI